MTNKKEANLPVGSKSRITTLESEIRKLKKQLARQTALYETSRKKLGKAYATLMNLVEQLTDIKVHNTNKGIVLTKKIKDGRAENVRLTNIRDAHSIQIQEIKDRLTHQGLELMTLLEHAHNEAKTIDDIVIQVFGLNATVVQAAKAREECLKRHVFPRLINAKGNLVSQVTFDSLDGLKRVVAMVNTMTIIRGDMAREAEQAIQSFLEKFQKPTDIDPRIKALFDLTKQLLVEKIEFKPGPSFYRFISLELDAEIFPELAHAQKLLRMSIRYEKTNSYIRISQRDSNTENWKPVPQS